MKKSAKLQAPSSREAPNFKSQKLESVASLPWDEQPIAESLELKESPNQQPGDRHPFDLEERTAIFGENIVRLCKRIPRHPANDRLIDQLVGCGTSVGANYCEANEGVSKKDFRHR